MNLPSDRWPVLCSCKTFRKRSIVSDANGIFTETITHGIASLFCDPADRLRGYGSRMMNEFAVVLRSWQVEGNKCVRHRQQILCRSWMANFFRKLPCIELAPLIGPKPSRAKELLSGDLVQLCREDSAMM